MACRMGCGACCVAPSISSEIPGMQGGKPGGVRCIHLTDDLLCSIFNSPERPKVCAGFQAESIFCGNCREEAIEILGRLEGLSEERITDLKHNK